MVFITNLNLKKRNKREDLKQSGMGKKKKKKIFFGMN